MIDNRIGHFVNSGGPVINFSKEVSLQRCENNGAPSYPNLNNEIEPCWNYLKDCMAQYNFIGSGEETNSVYRRHYIWSGSVCPKNSLIVSV